MSLALCQATPKSLIIIDEFGKGTQPEGKVIDPLVNLLANALIDGAGLLTGVLEHFLSLEDQCPKVIASTHFHGCVPPTS